MTHFIPGSKIIVETDASDYALSAIPSLITSDNELHPVAFHSWKFKEAKLDYDTHDKKLLAIFNAFKVWQHYFEGSPVVIDVITNHKNLEYFATTKV